MSQNNDVFSVLVTSGNQAVLPAGQSISDLSPNQVGFFDANTNVSIAGPAREFFIAVGIDSTGDGTVDSIMDSAGQKIQKDQIGDLSFRGHTASRPMIVNVADYKADCDTDYTIRVEFRNMQIYRTQGYNQFTKAYSIRTACCEDCASCPSGDGNEITIKMIEEINAQEDGLLVAEAIARQAVTIATHGTSVDYAEGDVMTIADVEALITFNQAQPDETTKVFSDLKLTSVELKVKAFCNINLMYFYPRQTKLVVSLTEGFSCNGAVEVVQEYAAEEGNGYDVRQKEFHAGAWNGNPGPYVLSPATGTARDINYRASSTEKYDQFVLTYDQFSLAGWLHHLNDLATIVAIPEADTVTRNSFATTLDAIMAGEGFDPLADDAAAVSTDPDVVEPTTDFDDVTLDGDA